MKIIIEADGDDALQLLTLLQGHKAPVEIKMEPQVAKPKPEPEPVPATNRSRWTKKEDDELVKLWQSGKRTSDCARIMNRTKNSIGNRIHHLRKKLGAKQVVYGTHGAHLRKRAPAKRKRPTAKRGTPRSTRSKK